MGGTIISPTSLKKEQLLPSATTTVYSWKGTANYYSLEVAGKVNRDAPWYYAEPSEAVQGILGRVAF